MDLRTVGDGFSFQPWYSKPLKHLLMSRWNKRDLCAWLCALLNQNIFADGCLQTTWKTTCADFSGGSRGWETAWSPQEAWSPQASQELFCQLSGQNREVTRSPSLQLSLVLIWLLSCSAHRAVESHQAHPNVHTFPSAPGRLGSVNLWFCDLMNLWCYDSSFSTWWDMDMDYSRDRTKCWRKIPLVLQILWEMQHCHWHVFSGFHLAIYHMCISRSLRFCTLRGDPPFFSRQSLVMHHQSPCYSWSCQHHPYLQDLSQA